MEKGVIMDNRKLEFYLLVIVLLAFCGCTIGLIVALFHDKKIDTAIPLVDGTLGTFAMAMWKDFSHSNQAQADAIPTPNTTSTITKETISKPEVKNETPIVINSNPIV